MTSHCKHPIVKIVSRDEDAEFVECQSCGEIFDSTEFRDIAIEEEEEAEQEKKLSCGWVGVDPAKDDPRVLRGRNGRENRDQLQQAARKGVEPCDWP